MGLWKEKGKVIACTFHSKFLDTRYLLNQSRNIDFSNISFSPPQINHRNQCNDDSHALASRLRIFQCLSDCLTMTIITYVWCSRWQYNQLICYNKRKSHWEIEITLNFGRGYKIGDDEDALAADLVLDLIGISRRSRGIRSASSIACFWS